MKVREIKSLSTASLLALKDTVAATGHAATLIDAELAKRAQEPQLTNVIYYT